MRSETGRIVAGAVLAGLCATPPADADEWRHTFVVYGMGAAIDGTTQIGNVAVPVDLSISDVFDALEMGAMAAYRADNGTWSITGDATYMGLGATTRTGQGRVRGDVDIDQFTVMGTLGRVAAPLEVLFSLAYFDLSTKLEVRTTAPVTGEVTTRNAGTGAQWIDPLIGLKYSLPFRDAWRLNLRGDVGGFGVGSDLNYQLLGTVAWQSQGNVGVVFGYRLIAFDYEDGERGTRQYERYDLTEQGPVVGVTWRF
jgi:hypothetical protein